MGRPLEADCTCSDRQGLPIFGVCPEVPQNRFDTHGQYLKSREYSCCRQLSQQH